MKTFLVGFIFSNLLIFSFPQFVFGNANSQLVTELLVTDNDSVFRYLYLYDNNGNKVLETKYLKQSDAWKRLTQTEWFFEGDKCSLQREKVWKVTNWDTSYEIIYDYSQEKLKSEIHKSIKNNISTEIKKIDFQYDSSFNVLKLESVKDNNQWILSQQTDFVYVNSKIDSITIKNFRNSTLNVEYSLKYFYNLDNRLATQLTKKRNAVEDDWTNDELVNYFYKKGTSNLTSQRNKIWDTRNSVWENSQMVDYKYDANNQLISEEYKIWETMFWRDNLKYEYLYDNQRLIKKSLLVPIYHQWRSLISIDYSDFVGNKANMISSTFDFWGGETGQFSTSFIPYLFNDVPTIQKANKILISYIPVDDTAIELINASEYNVLPVYPNPSDGIYYIDTQNYDLKSWKLLDLNGRVLKQVELTDKSGVIDISEFSKGVYLLQVNSNERQFTQKLMKK